MRNLNFDNLPFWGKKIHNYEIIAFILLAGYGVIDRGTSIVHSQLFTNIGETITVVVGIPIMSGSKLYFEV